MAINIELLTKTLEAIKANPQHFDQTYWHYRGTHNFAGFVELVANDIPIDTHADDIDKMFPHEGKAFWDTSKNAKELLGVSDDYASYLFSCDRIEDLEKMITKLIQDGRIETDEDVANEKEQNAIRYKWLADNKFFNVSIEKNFHKSSYTTTKEYIENSQITGSLEDLSEDAIQKMIEFDTVWEISVYPDNPIGFSSYISHDLNIALDQAIADYPLAEE